MWIKNASERGSKPQEKCLLVQQDEPGPSVLHGAAPQVHRSWAGAPPQRVQTGILPPPGFEPLEFLQVTSTKPHSITPRATQTPEGSQDPQHSAAAPLLGSQTQGKRNPSLFSSSHTQINPASSAGNRRTVGPRERSGKGEQPGGKAAASLTRLHQRLSSNLSHGSEASPGRFFWSKCKVNTN